MHSKRITPWACVWATAVALVCGGAIAAAKPLMARTSPARTASPRSIARSLSRISRAHRPTSRPSHPANTAGTSFSQRNVAWQVALEREGFSPGLIDGRGGVKTALATREYQKARGLNITGQLDEATAEALGIHPDEAVLTSYVVEQSDLSKVAPPPKSWLAKSKAKFLGHNNLAEVVAERFHCSQGLLATLNPRVSLSHLKVGETLSVPAVHEGKTPRVHRLEVDLTQKAIRAYAADGRQIALFHCSIAAKAEHRPRGEARVLGVANDPHYLFDPKVWPEVKGIDKKLLIPPGPKNPVGLCWIGLSLKGYGIHGTPNPELIGKTGSHGCLRLTNWDAIRLGKMVTAGMPVKFVGGR